MDFKGMVDKAKDWSEDNPEKADGFVDKASDAAGQRLGGHEQQVDAAGNKAKDFLHGPEGGAHGDPAAGQTPQGEPAPHEQVPPGEPQPPR